MYYNNKIIHTVNMSSSRYRANRALIVENRRAQRINFRAMLVLFRVFWFTVGFRVQGLMFRVLLGSHGWIR